MTTKTGLFYFNKQLNGIAVNAIIKIRKCQFNYPLYFVLVTAVIGIHNIGNIIL